MSLLGGGVLCAGKFDCPLATSFPPYCLVEMDTWRIVLKRSTWVKHSLNFSFKPNETMETQS